MKQLCRFFYLLSIFHPKTCVTPGNAGENILESSQRRKHITITNCWDSVLSVHLEGFCASGGQRCAMWIFCLPHQYPSPWKSRLECESRKHITKMTRRGATNRTAGSQSSNIFHSCNRRLKSLDLNTETLLGFYETGSRQQISSWRNKFHTLVVESWYRVGLQERKKKRRKKKKTQMRSKAWETICGRVKFFGSN